VTASSARASSASEEALPLGPRALHLWLCRSEPLPGSGEFLRQVLSRYADLPPGGWRFAIGRWGKPEIVDPPRPLAFNLSDSGGWRACAVTAGTAVGVDLERCEARRDVLRLARRFYHPAEAAALQAVGGAARSGAFYDYWTLKEAHVKAAGLALAPALAACAFEVVFPASRAPGTVAGPPPGPAHYCLIDLPPGYRIATCWLGGDGAAPQIALREWHPAGGERPVEYTLRALSGRSTSASWG
jgi:4'-phosphopantetheinyl transferase